MKLLTNTAVVFAQ